MTTDPIWYGLDLRRPDPKHVDLEDIAHALSGIRRWQGRGMSVAAHCLRVASAVPEEARLWALLHDAHEAYIGDASGPLWRAVPGISRVANRVDVSIRKAFGLEEPTPEVSQAIRDADISDREWELSMLTQGPREWFDYSRTDVYAKWLGAVRALLP